MGFPLHPDMRVLPVRFSPDQQPVEENTVVATHEVTGVEALFGTIEYIKNRLENRDTRDDTTSI